MCPGVKIRHLGIIETPQKTTHILTSQEKQKTPKMCAVFWARLNLALWITGQDYTKNIRLESTCSRLERLLVGEIGCRELVVRNYVNQTSSIWNRCAPRMFWLGTSSPNIQWLEHITYAKNSCCDRSGFQYTSTVSGRLVTEVNPSASLVCANAK